MKSQKNKNDFNLLKKENNLLISNTQSGDIKVGIVYPNSYWIGMSNLGFQTIYKLWREEKRFFADRAYYTNSKKENKGIKLFESKKPLGSLDLLGISLSFEEDYIRAIEILKEAFLDLDISKKIALGEDSAFRLEETKLKRPFFLAGGTAVSINPEPLAPFFDAIVIGEAEELLKEFNEVFIKSFDKNLSYKELLKSLSSIEGVYVPKFYNVSYFDSFKIKNVKKLYDKAPDRVNKRFIKNLDSYSASSVIETKDTEFSSKFLLETSRGCETGCRFCVASYAYRPVRRRKYKTLTSLLDKYLKYFKSAGFVGASVSSHPELLKLFNYVNKTSNKNSSLSSLMTHKVTKNFSDTLTSSGYKSVALAPETGSEELRFKMGKKILNSEILKASRLLVSSGVRNIKLYFMVTLPAETIEDVYKIGELVDKIRKEALEEGLKCKPNPIAPNINVSLNPFIPKPWTPLSRHGMSSLAEIKKRINIVKKDINKLPNCNIKVESPRKSYIQAVYSRGDRRLGFLLANMVQNNRDWKWLIKNGNSHGFKNVPYTDFYALRDIGLDEKKPWDIVNFHISEGLLNREYKRALEEDVSKEIERRKKNEKYNSSC